MIPSAGESDRWTPWYSLGIWTANDGGVVKPHGRVARTGGCDANTPEITRHSIARQEDADARVATDTVVLRRGLTAAALQLAVRLHRSPGVAESPSVHALFAATSGHPTPLSTLSRPTVFDLLIPLSQCSQMVYPDGGEVWCSPTAVSMVLARWLSDTGSCEPRVRAAVAGVYDHVYRGHGNWPFNTAYAFHAGHEAGLALEAYVMRLPSIAAAEAFLLAGIPLVISYGWRAGELTGAPVPTSNGHLVVLAGVDARGDPIIHDPAAPTNTTVRRTYRRAEIERLWLSHSAGTAYAIHPVGLSVSPSS